MVQIKYKAVIRRKDSSGELWYKYYKYRTNEVNIVQYSTNSVTKVQRRIRSHIPGGDSLSDRYWTEVNGLNSGRQTSRRGTSGSRRSLVGSREEPSARPTLPAANWSGRVS